MGNDAVVYKREYSTCYPSRPSEPTIDLQVSFLTIYADRCHTMSIGKEVEELMKTSNDTLIDSFKGLLEQTVSQIKRSNEESAENQMKEIKFNEPHKFKKNANEDQFKFNQELSETLEVANPPPKCRS